MGKISSWSIRRATVDDIEELVRLRLAMMAEMADHFGDGAVTGQDSELADANRAFMREAIPAGEFVSYVVESGGEMIASSGLRVHRVAPHTGNLEGVSAYILNMYTVPAWRGRGLATALLEQLVRHARGAGAKSVSLRASAAGRSVYEGYGFASDDSFMSLRMAGADSLD